MNQRPSFDLISCTGKAYNLVWAERRYLLRLAAVPFLFKIIFFTLGYMQGGDENMLRLSLFMTPAWIVEGWMLAHIVRLVMLGQRWPFKPTGDREVDLPVLQSRYRGVLGGAVTFALIQLLIGGWFALLMYFVPVSLDGTTNDAANISPESAMMGCVLLGVALYAFRFLWLYVPAAVGAPIRPAAQQLSAGLSLSVRLLGLWFLCSVPAMLALQVCVGIVLMLIGPENAGDAVMVISLVAKVILDIIKNIICAVAVCFALREIFAKEVA